MNILGQIAESPALPQDCCRLCGGSGEDVFVGWYSTQLPLCKSCRKQVVIRHDQVRTKIPLPGSVYAHKKHTFGPEHLSAYPWPLVGIEPEVTTDTYKYYRSVKNFIEQEALKPLEERQRYIEANKPAFVALRPLQHVTGPSGDTTKVTPSVGADGLPSEGTQLLNRVNERIQEKAARQLVLFEAFPPA